MDASCAIRVMPGSLPYLTSQPAAVLLCAAYACRHVSLRGEDMSFLWTDTGAARSLVWLVVGTVAGVAIALALMSKPETARADHYIPNSGSSCWGGLVHGTDVNDGAWHARIEQDGCGVNDRECRTY